MEAENQTSRGNREASRRTIVKGAAWSVPVIAAAVATPIAAATFEPCSESGSFIRDAYGVYTVTIPECATLVTYSIRGGGGASRAVTTSGASNGAVVSGSFTMPSSVTDRTLTLIVGEGGQHMTGINGGRAAGGRGFGAGGAGTQLSLVQGGGEGVSYGGGGGSALLYAATPVIVAGGGGGNFTPTFVVDPDGVRRSGNRIFNAPDSFPSSGYTFGNGSSGWDRPNGSSNGAYWLSNPDQIILTLQPGLAANGAVPGGGSGSYWRHSPSLAVAQGGNGQAGGAPGTGQNGGGNGGDANVQWSGLAATTGRGGAGGGGGGWAGGGGGSQAHFALQAFPDRYGTVSSAGGAGSSYVAEAPVGGIAFGPATIDRSSVPPQGSFEGHRGEIFITWS